MAERFIGARTTVVVAIAPGDLTGVFESDEQFPPPPYRLRMGVLSTDEIVIVTARVAVSNGVQLTLTRAQESTTAGTYAPGLQVQSELTPGGIAEMDPGGGGGDDPGVVIYRPGGTPAGNVYTDLALACAALLAGNEPAVLYFDGSASGGTITLPVANFDHGVNVTWRGVCTLNFSAGTSFTTPPVAIEGMVLAVAQVGVDVFTYSGGSNLLKLGPFLRVNGAVGSGVLVNCTGGGLAVVCQGGVTIDGTFNRHLTNNGGSMSVFCTDGTTFTGQVIGGAAASSLIVTDSTAIDAANYAPTLPTVTRSLGSQSNLVGYTAATPGNWGAAPTNDAAALDALAGSVKVAVWRPAGTAGGNVFTGLAAAATALRNTGAGPKILYFDFGASGGNTSISGVTFDTGPDCVWVGNYRAGVNPASSSSPTTLLHWGNGMVVTTPPIRVVGLNVSVDGDSPLVVYGNDQTEIDFEWSRMVANNMPIVRTTGAGNVLVDCLHTTFEQGPDVPTPPFDCQDVGGMINVSVWEGSGIDASATGAGTVNRARWSPSAGVTGGPVTNKSDAARVVYTAANTTDWSGVNPSSVADALDRIAAKITPIP